MTVPTQIKNIKNDRRKKKGAAMMAVMLILLLATAGAAVTVESTGFESRATGYNRIATQAKNISESSLVSTISLMDRVGAQSLWNAMVTNYEGDSGKLRAMNDGMPADEPPLIDGKLGYRVKYGDYSSVNPPFDTQNAIGPNRSHTVNFSVDIYDSYITNKSLPGYHAEGKQGVLQFLQASYIARGQLMLAGNRQIEHVSCACIEAGPFSP